MECGVLYVRLNPIATKLALHQNFALCRLIKWCAKAARQYDCDNVLSFLGVARDVSFPVRILDENSFSRRKASHLSIARFKFHVAIQPYGEESIRRLVKARFAHPGGDVSKTDA